MKPLDLPDVSESLQLGLGERLSELAIEQLFHSPLLDPGPWEIRLEHGRDCLVEIDRQRDVDRSPEAPSGLGDSDRQPATAREQIDDRQ